MTPADLTEFDVAQAIGPLQKWHHECHAASLHLVNSGLLPDNARVARGTLRGVGGQHSWVVVGGSCYQPEWIVDVTAWSYDSRYERVLVLTGEDAPHHPHGKGSVWEWGCPSVGDGEAIELAVPLSAGARLYLRTLIKTNGRRSGIDRRGWMNLANGPMEDWPAKEIIEAMLDTPELVGLVPIDIAGMVTDRNPLGLYLASPDHESEAR